MRLRFSQLHFMIGHGFLSSYVGRGGLWELCSLPQRGTPVRSFAEKKQGPKNENRHRILH